MMVRQRGGKREKESGRDKQTTFLPSVSEQVRERWTDWGRDGQTETEGDGLTGRGGERDGEGTNKLENETNGQHSDHWSLGKFERDGETETGEGGETGRERYRHRGSV